MEDEAAAGGIAQGAAGGVVVRVGIDLVRISEVVASIDRFGDRFVDRLFTTEEQRYCRRDSHSAPARFAARFAAKEATTKVLRPEHEGLGWRSIEVRRAPGGWCDIVLHGPAAELARRSGIRSLALSMSHEGDYATAVVVAQCSRLRAAGP